MNARTAAIAELERRIGHDFQDRGLLERALTHASVGDGARAVRHYERLEFLGDRVLNLLAAERLMTDHPDAREGEMSRRLAAAVNIGACARVAREIGLSPALRLSASATKVGARDSENVLGDACEALIGAIYLDSGLAGARRFFEAAWAAEMARADDPALGDPKTRLQEWAQGQGLDLPQYVEVAREGPDHAPRFTAEVRIKGTKPARGEGASKRAAEQAAATALLAREGVRRGTDE